jgi:2,3-diaminopropionate biosynthesis protein SbnA
MSVGILSTIGNTPTVRLEKLYDDVPFQVFAKLEAFNPGGSIKDRTAFNIISRAIERGAIQPGATVIESSSGNMAIGLAQVCSSFGLHFICVVDIKTTQVNLEILRVYGAQIDLVTEPDPVTGEFLHARIDRVKTLLQDIPNSFWPDQYANLDNPGAHHQTMREIATALDGKVDYLFCSTSTCGTLRGCVEYIRMHNLGTRVYAVDALGSAIFGSPPTRRLIPGHGASRIPEIFQPDLADQCIHVSDVDCILGCRRLLKREVILAGGSSGGVVAALGRVKESVAAGANCALILCDRGERYLDTIYSEAWVRKYFGELDTAL